MKLADWMDETPKLNWLKGILGPRVGNVVEHYRRELGRSTLRIIYLARGLPKGECQGDDDRYHILVILHMILKFLCHALCSKTDREASLSLPK